MTGTLEHKLSQTKSRRPEPPKPQTTANKWFDAFNLNKNQIGTARRLGAAFGVETMDQRGSSTDCQPATAGAHWRLGIRQILIDRAVSHWLVQGSWLRKVQLSWSPNLSRTLPLVRLLVRAVCGRP